MYTYNKKTGTYTVPSYKQYLSPEDYRQLKNRHKLNKKRRGEASMLPLILFMMFVFFILNALYSVNA